MMDDGSESIHYRIYVPLYNRVFVMHYQKVVRIISHDHVILFLLFSSQASSPLIIIIIDLAQSQRNMDDTKSGAAFTRAPSVLGSLERGASIAHPLEQAYGYAYGR